jgi:hypothetical protein
VTKTLEIIVVSITALSGVCLVLIKFDVIQNSTLKNVFLVFAILGILVETGYRIYKSSLTKFSSVKVNNIREVLDFTCQELEQITGHPFRANIMWPSGIIFKKLRIRCSSKSMDDADDIDIVLDKWQGCAGAAWGYNHKVAADMSLELHLDGPAWNLDQEQQNKTKKLKTIISIPIHPEKEPGKVTCILNYDSVASFVELGIINQQIDKYTILIKAILKNQEMI